MLIHGWSRSSNEGVTDPEVALSHNPEESCEANESKLTLEEQFIRTPLTVCSSSPDLGKKVFYEMKVCGTSASLVLLIWIQ